MKSIITIILISVSAVSFSQQQVPFTLEDRDRLMRVEERLHSLEKNMDVKFEDQQRQIDDLKTMFTWGFSILITIMLFILGYIIWDRRTAMHPMMERITSLEHRTVEVERIKAALKEMGESDQKIAEILKRAAIF